MAKTVWDGKYRLRKGKLQRRYAFTAATEEIKLADKSEAGWLSVKEYEADGLASVSDYEKRSPKSTRVNAITTDKARRSSTPYFNDSRGSNDQLFFRGNLFPFFVLSRGRQVLARRLPSMFVYMCLVKRRRKMIFLRMNVVK